MGARKEIFRSLAAIFGGTVLLVAAAHAQGTWVASSTGDKADLVAAYFTSATRGFVAGDAGFLASTFDGGKTWTKYDLKTHENLNEIYFRNNTDGYLVTGRKMYRTSDGGATWEETNILRAADIRNGTPEFISIRFSDKDHGMIIGSITNTRDQVVDSLLMRTDNGGDTWSRVELPTKKEVFHLDMTDDSHAWIVGDEGVILASSDGGTTWRRQASGVSRALFSVDFRDAREGFAVGGGGTILRTENGGETWTRTITPFTETLKRVVFFDDKNGWAVGHRGTILRTNDKGLTWLKQDARASADLYGLFVTKKFGCAVGEHGTVMIYQR